MTGQRFTERGAECHQTHVKGYTGPICSCPPLVCKADPHARAMVFNVGFEDEPDWKFICDCGYESWGHGSEVMARQIHLNHKALSTWGSYG